MSSDDSDYSVPCMECGGFYQVVDGVKQPHYCRGASMTDSERIDCRTVDEPPLPKGPRYLHPRAKSIGECYDGCCIEYRCPDCGVEFDVEMAE